MTKIEKVLVLGASADQGIPLVGALQARGVTPIAGARRLDAMQGTAYPNLQTIEADITDQASMQAAFSQVDAVAMHLPFAFDPEVAASYGRNIANAAAATGLKKIVFNTSCVVADRDNGVTAHDGRRSIEQSIRDSGVDYVILRPAVFMDNIIRVWCKPTIVNKNMFVYPAKEDLKVSWICLEDVAALSAYSIVTDSLRNESITVGGPQALTGFEVAAELSKASGREIVFNSIPPQTFAENMSELVTGSRDVVPESVYDGMAKFYAWYNDQPESPVKVEYASFSGKLPVKLSTFAEWASRQNWNTV
jgi:uncharacterized protein YbjT (DUF2867 family)